MKNSFYLLMVIITAFNCQQEVVLPELPYNSRVIIQGIVEPDSVPIVYLNRTIPYVSGSTDPADLVVRNATVTISTLGETDILQLDSAFVEIDCSYQYFYKGSSRVKKNTAYTLEIIHGSKTYTATTTTSLAPVTIDKVSYTPAFKDLYGEHEGVITYFHDIPNEDNYYRFEMLRKVDRSTRYVTGNKRDLIVPCIEEGDTILFTEIGRSVYNDKNLQGQQIKIVIEPALTHHTIVTVFVRIQTMDKVMFDFYDQLDGQKLAQYNPFVEPVFIKDGQFGKDAAGFFGSIVRSEAVKFEMPAED